MVPTESAGADISGVDTFMVTVLSVAQISIDAQELRVMELAYSNISSIAHTSIEPIVVTVTEKLESSQYFFIPISLPSESLK